MSTHFFLVRENNERVDRPTLPELVVGGGEVLGGLVVEGRTLVGGGGPGHGGSPPRPANPLHLPQLGLTHTAAAAAARSEVRLVWFSSFF